MSDNKDTERRSEDSLVLQVMKHMDDRFKEFREEVKSDIKELFDSAFVDGDPRGHKEAHQRSVDSARSWSDIWVDVKKKVISGVAWGMVVGAFGVIGTAIGMFVKKYFGWGEGGGT